MQTPDLKSLSTEELDVLLAAVVAERSNRQPPVPMEQPQTIEAVIDPRWYLFMAGENTVMQMRHPGHGWLGFLVPPASRAQLLSFLLQHALMPVAPPAVQPAAPANPATGGGTVH